MIAFTVILFPARVAETTPVFELDRLGLPLILLTVTTPLSPGDNMSELGDNFAAMDGNAKNDRIMIESQFHLPDRFIFLPRKM